MNEIYEPSNQINTKVCKILIECFYCIGFENTGGQRDLTLGDH